MRNVSLPLFWLKIAAKEAAALFKTSPIVIIWAAIITAAFMVGGKDAAIRLNGRAFAITVSFLFFAALLVSTEKYDIVPRLILYAKSDSPNRIVGLTFFAEKAIANNVVLLVFDLIVFRGILKTEYALYLPWATLLSAACSFACMVLRNKFAATKIAAGRKDTVRIYPLVKGALHDYCAPGFVQEAALSFGLFIALMLELANSKTPLSEAEYPPAFFMLLLLILAIGFMGLIDSAPHINWKFYAILSSRSFKHHMMRTIIFLSVFFGLMVLSLIVMAARHDLRSLAKYLYIVLALLLFSTTVAFSMGSALIKCFGMAIFAFFAVWLCGFNAYLLWLLLIPMGISFVKAKNDHGDWYLV
jgi:hypothetical protein